MVPGLYVHIPFCRSRCGYCHFVTDPWSEALAERYCGAVCREIASQTPGAPQAGAADSVYFGGGTPSLIPARHIERLLDALRASVGFTRDCEVTLEANPETISPKKAEAWLAMGVNRVSVGAQSFVDAELKAVGRRHDARAARNSIRALRQTGFDNLSLDLILGLPGQSRESWGCTLEASLEAAPDHLSVYMLDLDDAHAPLRQHVASGDWTLPEEDLVADLYAETVERLQKGGLMQYEISNFCRGGCECRHNLKYWECLPVLGFGVAAHSYDGRERYANVSDLAGYLDCVESGRTAVAERRVVSRLQGIEESLFLGLRLNRGVSLEGIRRRYGGAIPPAMEAALATMTGEGLTERLGEIVRLTARGRLLSNEVFSALIQ